jgi:hypothetical protein
MEFTVKRFARLAAMGAMAVAIGTFGLYLLLGFGTRSAPASGIDPGLAAVTWIALAVPFAAIIAVHVAYARLLLRYSRD